MACARVGNTSWKSSLGVPGIPGATTGEAVGVGTVAFEIAEAVATATAWPSIGHPVK